MSVRVLSAALQLLIRSSPIDAAAKPFLLVAEKNKCTALTSLLRCVCACADEVDRRPACDERVRQSRVRPAPPPPPCSALSHSHTLIKTAVTEKLLPFFPINSRH